MDLLQSGITILYVFGVLEDGLTEEEEGEIIGFCEEALKTGAVTEDDVQKAFETLSTLNPDGLYERFLMSLDYIKKVLPHDDRLIMLDYIFFQINADGKIGKVEQQYFTATCEHWGIDLEGYAKRLERMAQSQEQAKAPKKKSPAKKKKGK